MRYALQASVNSSCDIHSCRYQSLMQTRIGFLSCWTSIFQLLPGPCPQARRQHRHKIRHLRPEVPPDGRLQPSEALRHVLQRLMEDARIGRRGGRFWQWYRLPWTPFVRGFWSFVKFVPLLRYHIIEQMRQKQQIITFWSSGKYSLTHSLSRGFINPALARQIWYNIKWNCHKLLQKYTAFGNWM